jgi:hypothetical protein
MTLRPRNPREKELIDAARAETEARIRAEYAQRNDESPEEAKRLTIADVRSMSVDQINDNWDEVCDVLSEAWR